MTNNAKTFVFLAGLAMIIQRALSRRREFEADRVGAQILGRSEPLANELMAMRA